MEQQDKPIWLSKSVIGGLVALVGGIAGVFGFDVPAEVQGEIVASLVAIGGGLGVLVYHIGQIWRNRKG